MLKESDYEKLLKMIYEYKIEHTYSPSLDDIKESLHLGHQPTQNRLNHLVRMGWITKKYRQARTIRITQSGIRKLNEIGIDTQYFRG